MRLTLGTTLTALNSMQPAFWTMGNLGRAGYMKSTSGMWPYRYALISRGRCSGSSSEQQMWQEQMQQ